MDRWEPYKEARGVRVEIGARQECFFWERPKRHVIARVKPNSKRMQRAWRRAERFCEKANAAAEAAEADL